MEIFFWKGIILGFSVAAPVGPLGILCIRRTLNRGRFFGFLTGLGAATADCLYGLIAGLGLTAISSALVGQQSLIRLVGGIFLIYLGLRIFLARPDQSAGRKSEKDGVLVTYMSALVLTLTNPATILSFAAMFAGLGLGSVPQFRDNSLQPAAVLVAGVFLGSCLWWTILSSGTDMFRRAITPSRMVWINRASGSVIIVFALIAVWTVLRSGL